MLRTCFIAAFVLMPLACGGSHDGRDSSHPHPESEHDGTHSHGKHTQGHAHTVEGRHAQGDEPLGRRFQGASEWAKRFDNPARDAWQMPSVVVSLMKIKPGMTVADIGAGTGYFLPTLSAAAGNTGTVLGLDIEDDMVRYMQLRAKSENLGNVHAKRVPVSDPGLAPASTDRILIVNTWHHIPNRVEYTKNMAKALRDGGCIFIVDFTLETDRGPHKEHRLSPEFVVEELQRAGLAAKVMTEPLPDQYIVEGCFP